MTALGIGSQELRQVISVVLRVTGINRQCVNRACLSSGWYYGIRTKLMDSWLHLSPPLAAAAHSVLREAGSRSMLSSEPMYYFVF